MEKFRPSYVPTRQAVVKEVSCPLGDPGVRIPALPETIKLLGSKDTTGTGPEAGLRVLSGMGPAAASAVPRLVALYADAKGANSLVTRTLAAIGPAASDAVDVLEKHRTLENRFLADTCYALFCIRGDESDLEMMAGLLGDKDRPRGYESGEWRDIARFIGALGGKAAPVAELVRERSSLLDSAPSLKRRIETVFLKRVEEGAKPLRLQPR